MSEEKLKKLIAQLDVELESTDITDNDTRESLSQLLIDVREKLENPVDVTNHSRITHDLQEIALKFEVNHPKLTKILNEISNILSNIGI